MSKKIPNGLVFSSNNPARKKRSFILFIICLFLQAAVIWPVYSMFADPEPMVLGLPLSFAWMILIILLSFSTMLIFFQFDEAKNEENE